MSGYDKRVIYEKELGRWNRYVNSEKAKNAKSAELTKQIESVENAFLKFMSEHAKCVECMTDSNQRAKEDEYCDRVKLVHHSTIASFRTRVADAEIREMIERGKTNKQEIRANSPSVRSAIVSINRDQHKRRIPYKNNDLRLRLLINAERKKPEKIFSCHYCKGQHKIFDCTLLRNLSLKERCRQVRALNLCSNCLMPQMNERDNHICRSSHCHRCGVREFHNSLLCPRKK